MLRSSGAGLWFSPQLEPELWAKLHLALLTHLYGTSGLQRVQGVLRVVFFSPIVSAAPFSRNFLCVCLSVIACEGGGRGLLLFTVHNVLLFCVTVKHVELP